MDMIQSELQKMGKNEFFNNNQLTFYDDEFAFIKKAMNYDKDVDTIVTRMFFSNFRFNPPELDNFFKRAFTTRFLNRQIQTQTVEIFASKVASFCLSHQQEIEGLYSNFEKMLSNTGNTNTRGNSNQLHDSRMLDSTLPQDNINLNVDDTVLDYGDRNNISRDRTTNDTTNDTTSTKFDPDTFKKLMGIYEYYFRQLDKKCFLHVW